MKNLKVSVTLSEAEFLKFSLQRYYQSLLGRIITIFGLILLVGPVILFLIKPELVDGKFPFSQFALGIVFTLIIPLLIFRASKKAYYGNTQLSEETQYTFDNDGINLNGQSFSLHLKWNRIVEVVENTDFFLLYITKQSCHILPKAQLSEKQKSHIREFVKSTLGLGHRLFE